MVSGGEGYITVTQAQEPPPPPQSLTAVNGLNLGTATLTWTTVPGVSSYRVGWLAKEDYLAYIDDDNLGAESSPIQTLNPNPPGRWPA